VSLTIAVKTSSNEHTLIWAVVCSMLLHGLLAIVVPNFQFDDAPKPDTLEIELVKKPEPPPVVLPEPPPPEPVKPKVEPKPQPITKPLPTPTVVKSEPILQTPPPPPPPEVIAVAPKVDTPPSPVPPAPIVVPEPPRPPAPSEADMNEARGKYGNTLWGAISKEKKYPKIAQMRGWQGEAIVELLLDGNGKLKSKKIIQSSGHEVLDKQALEMVEKAAPYPMPPEVLRGSNFTITVPIPFKLE
jgi:protein TonB